MMLIAKKIIEIFKEKAAIKPPLNID